MLPPPSTTRSHRPPQPTRTTRPRESIAAGSHPAPTTGRRPNSYSLPANTRPPIRQSGRTHNATLTTTTPFEPHLKQPTRRQAPEQRGVSPPPTHASERCSATAIDEAHAENRPPGNLGTRTTNVPSTPDAMVPARGDMEPPEAPRPNPRPRKKYRSGRAAARESAAQPSTRSRVPAIVTHRPNNPLAGSGKASPKCRTAMLAAVSDHSRISPIANASNPAIRGTLRASFGGACSGTSVGGGLRGAGAELGFAGVVASDFAGIDAGCEAAVMGPAREVR